MAATPELTKGQAEKLLIEMESFDGPQAPVGPTVDTATPDDVIRCIGVLEAYGYDRAYVCQLALDGLSDMVDKDTRPLFGDVGPVFAG